MNTLNIPAIRAAHRLSDIVGASVKLRKAGREFAGCCPFHEDRSPSFYVNDQKGSYYCFGCRARGDVLDFVQAADKVSLREAAMRLGAGMFPNDWPPSAIPKAKRDTVAEAVEIWSNAGPVAGTPAEANLRNRGLRCRLPECIRFTRLRYGYHGPEHPVLVAAVAAPDSSIKGIQRTYLTDDGRKANVPEVRLSLGRLGGGAIRCAPAAAELILTEGLEDALSLQQELRQPAWAVAGAGGLSTIKLPFGVRSVIIGADADETGLREARKAAKRFAAEGRRVRIIQPLDGHKDFNAELTEAHP